MPDTRSAASPIEIAIEFTNAWTGGDFETVTGLVSEKVTFDGPMAKLSGKDKYIDGLKKLGAGVTGYDMVAAFGDADRALLMYRLNTKAAGQLLCSKLLTIEAGRITDDLLTFDPRKLLDAGKPPKPTN